MSGNLKKIKSTVFIFVALSFLSGVALRSFILIPFADTLFLGVLFLSLGIGLYIKKNLVASVVCCMAVFFCIGVVRYELTLRPPEPVLYSLVNTSVSLHGIIISSPKATESRQQFIVRVESLAFQNVKQSIPLYQYLVDHYPIDRGEESTLASITPTRILVSTDVFPTVHIGDRISFTGKLTEPSSFITDIGKEFNYQSYLAKDNVFYTVSFAKIDSFVSPSFHIFRSVISIRDTFLQALNKTLHEPDSALAGGILLGVKQSLGGDLEQSFIRTGLIHIIVLSGYNIGIIIWFFMWLGKDIFRIGKRKLIPMVIGLIGLFMIMVGLGASIVRAGVMTGLALGAKFFGRESSATRLLIFAGCLIVFISPRVLVFDISFQLSFLATIGMLYATPMFERWLWFIPSWRGIREIVSATFGTQLTVLPFLLWRIGTLSIIAPITNVIILPFIPTAMLASFITGVGGMINLSLGRLFGSVTHLILSAMIGVVEWFSNFSFSSYTLQSFPLWLTIILYVGISILLVRYNRKYGNTK